MAARPCRVMAPISRFSSTVWREKVPRPCGTCAIPSRTMSSVAWPVITLLSNRMAPCVRHMPESERHHGVADRHHHAHVMLHQKDGGGAFVANAADQLAEPVDFGVIEPAG